MTRGKTLTIAIVMLVIGFSAGFVLRPVLAPTVQTVAVSDPASTASLATEARSTQYFAADLDDARQVVAGCRDGSVRGDECANAEAAVVEAEGRDRFKTFTGN